MLLVIYAVFKNVHLIGVIVLIGNVTITSFWKVFADRSRDPRLIAHAQYMVTITDWVFTIGGILLLCIGGFGAAYAVDMNPFSAAWLIEAELLFAASGTIWLVILVPIQLRQSRMVRSLSATGSIPEAYWQAGRRWLFWGIIATIPLIAAIYVMVVKV